MKKYIMIYSGNWNEEIDVDGFVMLNKKDVQYLTNFLKSYKDSISISLGSDYVEYDNGDELLDEISFQEINSFEYNTINKFFGESNDFGDNLILSIKESVNKNGLSFNM